MTSNRATMLAPAVLVLLALAGASAARDLEKLASPLLAATTRAGDTRVCAAALDELKKCRRQPAGSHQPAHDCCDELMTFADNGCFCNPVVMGFCQLQTSLSENAGECAKAAGKDPRAASTESCPKTPSGPTCTADPRVIEQERIEKIVELHELWYLSESLTWSIGMTMTPQAANQNVSVIVSDLATGVNFRDIVSDISSGTVNASPPGGRLSPTDITTSASSDIKTFDAKAKNGQFLRFGVLFLPCETYASTVGVITSAQLPEAAASFSVKRMLQSETSLSRPNANPNSPQSLQKLDADGPEPIISLESLEAMDAADVGDFEIVADIEVDSPGLLTSPAGSLQAAQRWVDEAMKQVEIFIGQIFPDTNPIPSNRDIPSGTLQDIAHFMQEMGLSRDDVDIDIDLDVDLSTDVLPQPVDITVETSSVHTAADAASEGLRQAIESSRQNINWPVLNDAYDRHDADHVVPEDLGPAMALVQDEILSELLLNDWAPNHEREMAYVDLLEEREARYGQDAFRYIDLLPGELLDEDEDTDYVDYPEEEGEGEDSGEGLTNRVRTSRFYSDDDEVMELARESLLGDAGRDDTDLTHAWVDYYEEDGEWELDDHLRQGDDSDLTAVMQNMHDAVSSRGDSSVRVSVHDPEGFFSIDVALPEAFDTARGEQRILELMVPMDTLVDSAIGGQGDLPIPGDFNFDVDVEITLEEDDTSAAVDIERLDSQVTDEQLLAAQRADLRSAESIAQLDARIQTEQQAALRGSGPPRTAMAKDNSFEALLILPEHQAEADTGHVWASDEM